MAKKIERPGERYYASAEVKDKAAKAKLVEKADKSK
jgi:hypothetical protein